MNEGNVKLVSIIVPVYNVAPYITKCMDSLRTQTLQDIEVIFVDDQGSDNSVQIIADYITLHSLQSSWRIVTMLENGGPGLARNIGMREATGKYFVFVDADDWIEADLCGSLYELCETEQTEIAMCSAFCHDKGEVSILKNPHYKSAKYFLNHYIPRLWTFMFRREFIQKYNLQFPPERSAEDSYFIAISIMHAKRVAQLQRPLYHYMVYPTSISHVRNTKRYRQKLSVFARLMCYAKEQKLMSQYRWTLYWIYFKKAIVTSVVDYFSSLFSR